MCLCLHIRLRPQHRTGFPMREGNFIKLLSRAKQALYLHYPFQPSKLPGTVFAIPISQVGTLSLRFLAQGCKIIVNTCKVFTTCFTEITEINSFNFPLITLCGRCYYHHPSLQRSNPENKSVLRISPKLTQPASGGVRFRTKAFWDLDSVPLTVGYTSTQP